MNYPAAFAIGIFIVVLILLNVFKDWLNYMNLQKRLRAERAARVRSRDIEAEIKRSLVPELLARVPVEVSDAILPNESLLIAPVFFDPEGEIDPNKVVKINVYPETDISEVAIDEHLREEDEG